MKHDFKLLKQIFDIPSPSGYTKKITAFMEDFLIQLGYKPYYSRKGNLLVDVIGTSPYKIGLSAHVDTLGLMVRSINSDGNLSFTRIGGPILPTLDGEYCTIMTRTGTEYTGTILSVSPSGHVHPESSNQKREESTMYIRLDCEVKSKKDTIDLGIQNGDFVFINPKFVLTETGFIKTRFLDDKASVYILLQLLKHFKDENLKPQNSLTFIFSTFEEVGHGASALPELDELIAVDMGCIGLDLACKEDQVSICAKDGSGPYDYELTTKLIEIAKANNINYCVDIYPFYSSDASAALRGGQDVKCALLGSGIHASHGMERTHLKGIEATFDLLLNYLK